MRNRGTLIPTPDSSYDWRSFGEHVIGKPVSHMEARQSFGILIMERLSRCANHQLSSRGRMILTGTIFAILALRVSDVSALQVREIPNLAAAPGQALVRREMIAQLDQREPAQRVVPDPAKRKSRDRGGERVRRHDCSDVLVIGDDDFSPQVRDLMEGAGCDVVYDPVGHQTFESSMNSLAWRGLLATYGAMSGPPPAIDLMRLGMDGSLAITRVNALDFGRTTTEVDSTATAVRRDRVGRRNGAYRSGIQARRHRRRTCGAGVPPHIGRDPDHRLMNRPAERRLARKVA